MSTAGKLVGIDLGTTFSAIATLDERGQAVTLPNQDGEMLTPSAVLIDEASAIVGQAARDVALEQPDRVALIIKRSIGHPKYEHPVAGREFRPETLSAIILKKLVRDAERRIGPVGKAVITVPAYFDDTRRKATKDAGRIAGLEVLDILDEPTAAALAYSFQQTQNAGPLTPDDPLPIQEQTVLVYDLGGGTFDVTLVHLAKHRFETLAIEGDVRLGGKDWDDRIVEYVAQQFKAKFGEDPRVDPITLAGLNAAAERAKRTLSKLQQTSITCSHAGKVLTVPLSRAEFENITKDLLTRTRLTTQQVMKQAKRTWDQVDRILLVGGSTHMPMTGRMIAEISGKTPDKSLAVSEVVARGAALHAGIVATRLGDSSGAALGDDVLDLLGDVVEINVNSHSLGIEIRKEKDRLNDILIPKNTQLPTEATRVYRTVIENQARVRVKVLQGDAPQADACISIGECWVEGLPPNLPKNSPIQVRCVVGANGLIDVTAIDQTSGKSAQTQIHRASGLSDDDLAKETTWLAGVAVE
ncbi:MAG: Hsp70 family protein [Planctomycetes bacterium]|nr:Hsp70 family protein [Planctomycetota bacterium]